ncbi:MAG TPA: hypothetical protein VFI02_21465 [Armatimonadota bacterium]|nr:hypothetical protein [Armatimonadota bacterium]
MKRAIWLATLAIVAGTIAGCKSGKSVSRVFQADMDTTWAAVIRVAKNVTPDKPLKLDRESGKIITGLVYGDIEHQRNSDYQVEKLVEVWRGVIKLEPKGTETKVTIRLQKGDLSVADDPRVVGTKKPEIGFVFWSNETEWQDKFLNMVGEELRK